MSWTYDPSQLKESELMQIRLLLGDTDANDPLLEDEEIEFYIDQNSDVNHAALDCINAILSRLAAIPEYKLGPYEENTSNRISFLNSLSKKLEDYIISYCPPLSENPTSRPIFGYDMMSEQCNHILGETNE